MTQKEEYNLVVRGRYAARFAAVQAIYQIEQDPLDYVKVVQQFLQNHFVEKGVVTYIKPDTTLFQKILQTTTEQQSEIDELISQFLTEGWRLDRIDSVVRAIFRAATCELLGTTEVPTPVVINEYLNITKEYFNGKEIGFVNGTLDSIAKHLIQKQGTPSGDN